MQIFEVSPREPTLYSSSLSGKKGASWAAGPSPLAKICPQGKDCRNAHGQHQAQKLALAYLVMWEWICVHPPKGLMHIPKTQQGICSFFLISHHAHLWKNHLSYSFISPHHDSDSRAFSVMRFPRATVFFPGPAAFLCHQPYRSSWSACVPLGVWFTQVIRV